MLFPKLCLSLWFSWASHNIDLPHFFFYRILTDFSNVLVFRDLRGFTLVAAHATQLLTRYHLANLPLPAYFR